METVEYLENALHISLPDATNIRLDDSRRITGPGLLWDHAGAVVDVSFEGFDPDTVVLHWQTFARRVLDAVGWENKLSIERKFDGGANLAISAPMDQLYSAIFAVETIWYFTASELLAQVPNNFDQMIDQLKSVMTREANPALLALINAANKRGIDVLCDDDEVSLGHGIGSQTWSVTDLPDPDNVNWGSLHNIPVALITGTNGKTTTTRLCAAIARASGKISGLTSTDFISVGDEILDRGDWSGPGGARMLLRNERLELAYLEVARGGILRRGLPLRKANVALVTNVAADHLGQYGVNTVPELSTAKFAVHRTLAENGVLVLNADDANIVAEATRTPSTIWWFSLNSSAPQIRSAVDTAVPCAWLDGDNLIFFDGSNANRIISVQNIPIAMAGAARYNILNALGAICVSRAMGLDYDSIRGGLSGFKNDPKDNPGRCNEFSRNGARVFVDFAHNPHSVAAVAEALSAIPAKRRFILLSHAGDRSDQDIRDLTTTVFKLNPDFVVAAELEEYLRGRELGEVTDLIKQTCVDHGMKPDQIIDATSPSDGVGKILSMLEPEDVALLLVLSERDNIFEMLAG